MVAQLTAVTANFSMCRPKTPYKVTDFMLSSLERQKPKRKPSQKKIVKALNVIFGVTHKDSDA